MLSKDQVIARQCKLSKEVMDKVFSYQIPADCVCEGISHPMGGGFQYDSEVLEFIEAAVYKAIEDYKGDK